MCSCTVSQFGVAVGLKRLKVFRRPLHCRRQGTLVCCLEVFQRLRSPAPVRADAQRMSGSLGRTRRASRQPARRIAMRRVPRTGRSRPRRGWTPKIDMALSRSSTSTVSASLVGGVRRAGRRSARLLDARPRRSVSSYPSLRLRHGLFRFDAFFTLVLGVPIAMSCSARKFFELLASASSSGTNAFCRRAVGPTAA